MQGCVLDVLNYKALMRTTVVVKGRAGNVLS